MEEKVLAKGVFSAKTILAILFTVAGVAFFFLTVIDLSENFDGALIAVGAVFALILFICALIFGSAITQREVIVTNKRIILKNGKKFRLDLPLEKVAHVSVCRFGGISFGSSSAKILFFFCKNNTMLLDTIACELVQSDSRFQ